jgi:hypothetical protein
MTLAPRLSIRIKLAPVILEDLMKRSLLIVALLGLFVGTLAGCHAEGGIDTMAPSGVTVSR